jgi:predicted metal-binding membrane protein
MNGIQKILIFSLIFISAIMWLVSIQQYDNMMSTMMMFYNPVALSVFTLIWTTGMAAMMFPAISPMVLLYDRLIKNSKNNNNSTNNGRVKEGKSSLIVGKTEKEDEDEEEEGETKKSLSSSLMAFLSWPSYSFKMILFVGSYLAVWALTGIAILLAWSFPINYFFMGINSSLISKQQLDLIFGILLIISGLYQFSQLKVKCLGYCESPMSFFMRRWRSGTIGAVKMGTYHGLYCLGCCWPYFLLMVALGWMNLLWMALFAAIIFGEKIWFRGGIWVARSAGIGFMIVGILAILGLMEIPTGMEIGKDNAAMDNSMDMTTTMDMGNTNNNNINMKDNNNMNMDMKENTK